MKLNCVIDTQGYSSKPKENKTDHTQESEYKKINKRICNAKQQELTIEELSRNIREGKAYIGGHFKNKNGKRNKENIENINMFSIDIDNKYRDKATKETVFTNYSIDEVIKNIENLLGIKPMISYTTFTGINKENNSPKFRLIYGIDSNINYKELELLHNHIANKYNNMVDAGTKDASRIFLATNKEVKSYKNYKLLDSKYINKLLQEQEQEIKQIEKERAERKEKRKNMNYDSIFSDNAIEDLKAIDLSDYLLNQGYSNIEKTSTGYKMPCPIHNGKNKNFTINNVNGVWLYTCFSKCGGAGGTIIDLHAELNNLTVAQAIKDLKNIYNIRPLFNPKTLKSPTTSNKTYLIDRYIGEDKKATEGILTSLKNNKKILITGSMGSGKTTFTSKNLFEFAKQNGKKLIMVIPSVAQLTNLYNTKNIAIVCNDSPVYLGHSLVATTPESLHKITEKVGAGNYILVVDESHERFTSQYRTGYKNRNIDTAEIKAYKSIHLTATPRLLAYDNFDEVITIKSKNGIKIKNTILKIKEKTDDTIESIIRKLLDEGRQVILFNNNIDENEIYADIFKKEKQITTEIYDESQLNMLKENKPRINKSTKTIVDTETIFSGKKSINVSSGTLKAQLTCTTSSIMAGIDLYTDDNAVLLINTRGAGIDNLLQLKGRFRNGIEVIEVIEEKENPKEMFNLYESIETKISQCQALADVTNENSLLTDLFDDDNSLKKQGYLIKNNQGKWIVDIQALVGKKNKEWSRAILENPKYLKELIESQDAFNLVNDITIYEYNGKVNKVVSEIKQESKEKRKELLKETSKKLMDLSDNDLYSAINKEHNKLTEKQIILYETYKEVAGTHIEKIKTLTKELFIDDKGIENKVGAFRKFYSEKWTVIQREINQKHAREINKKFKEHGLDIYLSKQAQAVKKTAIDIVQAKIRYELMDIEKKQGRLSNKRFTDLINILVRENYIYNKHTKILNDNSLKKKDKEKSLNIVADSLRDLVKNIYNFDSSGKLQSAKL